MGVEKTRRFLLETLSFQCRYLSPFHVFKTVFLFRYIPVGLLEVLPQKINDRPPTYVGRDEMETLLSSPRASDWVSLMRNFGFVRKPLIFLLKSTNTFYSN